MDTIQWLKFCALNFVYVPDKAQTNIEYSVLAQEQLGNQSVVLRTYALIILRQLMANHFNSSWGW